MPEHKKQGTPLCKTPRNKRGQVAETTTWIVATTIIIVIIFTSIYAATLISEYIKTVSTADAASFLNEQRTNIFLKESLLAFALTKNDEGVNVYKQIENANNLPTDAANLGIEVFKRAHDNPRVFSLFLKYDGVHHNAISYGNFEQKFQVVEKIKIDKDSALEVFYHIEELKSKEETK